MDVRAHADDLAAFVAAAPSSFHAAAEVARRLDAAGFTAQAEQDAFADEPRGGYVVRDGAIVAWHVPSGVDAATAGFRIVGAHTDSPALKLKPAPTASGFGYQQAAVEVYGGPLPNQWLDRELGVAGRLVTTGGEQRLVATPAWLRVPQVAPHLDRSVNEKLALDRQAHLKPIFAVGRPDLDLLELVAAEAGLDADDIAGHDLTCYPTEAPAVFGPTGEFFASSRLDNLSSVHAGLTALLAADEGDDITVLACFDHEEVGSSSRSGAAGPLLEQVMRRLAGVLGVTGDGWHRLLARSSCISSDAGHAIHPNYPHLHDPDHRPLLNSGPLLKHNANLRYTSDAASSALWRRACAAADVPTQDFVSNNAVPCGSTIGPMTAERLGVVMCDVGVPLLSMHSVRELAGVNDLAWLADALTAYYAGGLMDARQPVTTAVAAAVAAVSALVGLAPWLASGARLPLQNLWAKATAADDMPLVLLPISQYATTTIVALLLTGAALGGLTVRVLRKGMDGARGPLIGGAVGLSAVQLLAIGQSFWVAAEGHGLLDDTADPRAHLYVGALLAAALLTWLVALTVHALTASRRRGRVAFGLALSTVPFAAWLAAWATPFVHVEQGPGPLGVVMAWLPAVVVGGALGWAGFRRGDRWSWFWSLGVLWLLPPVLIACEAALGARNELGNWGAMLDTASMLFLATLDTSWHKVAVALGIALVVALVLHLTGRSGRRRSSSAHPSSRAGTEA